MKADQEVIKRAEKWLSEAYDENTRNEVKEMLENNPQELTDSFYKDLEFGTGGLRGIMGAGTNRMNRYTVGMATQGLANYLKMNFKDVPQIKVAIAYDCRNNNTVFARVTADVLSANDIKVYLFDDLRPTPELSFAIRKLGCQSGIMITASHNPKEYNGYKAYWDDGGQLINPHDVNVIDEVKKISSPEEVLFDGKAELIETIGADLDAQYVAMVKDLSVSPEIIDRQKDLKIVYTPIHGTGVRLVPMALKAFGFKNVINVPEQDVVDGNFPTVKSPNPEEGAALKMAIDKAMETGADLVMATDPDADRVGIAVRDKEGKFVLLNGNQTASLLIYYLLKKWQEKGKLTGKEFIVKTIVTSEILKDMAEKAGVEIFDVLTGFKFIADIIKKLEGKKQFIAGGEESYGYLVGDSVRDKDAVSSCCMIAETAAWAADEGKNLYELLPEIYKEFGFYREHLISVVKKGKAGADAIQQMMADFRENPPKEIAGSRLVCLKDYKSSVSRNLLTGEEEKIELPASNVLQFFTENGSKISVRPSGTEPKIKFYFGVKGSLDAVENYEKVQAELDARIQAVIKDLGLV